MQKIERKHLTLRSRLKRLARKTLRFSRSRVMHDLLIGLYMNRVEFVVRSEGSNNRIGTLPAYPPPPTYEEHFFLNLCTALPIAAFGVNVGRQPRRDKS